MTHLPSRESWYEPVDEALWSIGFYGDMDEDVLGEVEEWLDALTSAVATASGVVGGPDRLDELLDEIATTFDVAALVELKPDIVKLYEYGSAFSYGVCVLPRKKFIDAEECLLNVQGTFEQFIGDLK